MFYFYTNTYISNSTVNKNISTTKLMYTIMANEERKYKNSTNEQFLCKYL